MTSCEMRWRRRGQSKKIHCFPVGDPTNQTSRKQQRAFHVVSSPSPNDTKSFEGQEERLLRLQVQRGVGKPRGGGYTSNGPPRNSASSALTMKRESRLSFQSPQGPIKKKRRRGERKTSGIKGQKWVRRSEPDEKWQTFEE